MDGLVQSWSTLMQLGFLSQQVVFKCSPLRLGAFSPKDIANLLATSSYYNGNATQAAADMQLYMNLQPYYVGNRKRPAFPTVVVVGLGVTLGSWILGRCGYVVRYRRSAVSWSRRFSQG